MKKWMMFFLCALLALLPLGATAESLPEVIGAVSQGLSEGLRETAWLADQDLSLSLSAGEARIEEGGVLVLTVTAGNPYPDAADVTLTLDLPKRLSCAQPTVWQAQLPPAQTDPETGMLTPSVTAFTREVTLVPGSGAGEKAEVQVEMNMGVRFYRAGAQLELCVPSISASAAVHGTKDGLIEPGKPFTLVLSAANDGNAPKDVPYTLILPEGIVPDGELPEGAVLNGRTLSGEMRAQESASASVHLPLKTEKTLLDGDADASRLIAAAAMVDGERIPSPVLHVVGPMISAKLIPELDSLKEGGMMDLSIMVVNTGLAAADVELSCLLPEGLSVISAPHAEEETADAQPATEDEAEPLLPAAFPNDPGDPPAAAAEAVMSEAVLRPTTRQADGALVYALHMDAAEQTDAGVAAATKELRLRVRADMPMEDAGERLLGASLAWRTDDGDTQLSEAAALRVHSKGFLGLESDEWNGILLAALLMMVTICCLYSAVRSDNRQDDYCFE